MKSPLLENSIEFTHEKCPNRSFCSNPPISYRLLTKLLTPFCPYSRRCSPKYSLCSNSVTQFLLVRLMLNDHLVDARKEKQLGMFGELRKRVDEMTGKRAVGSKKTGRKNRILPRNREKNAIRMTLI